MSDEERIPDGVTAIVKPTHDCNMVCRYCYVDESAEKGIMDDVTLDNTVRKLSEFNGSDKRTHIIWHGGEPLLSGLGFFRMVVEVEGRYDPPNPITNSVQTNGTLLDEGTLDFLVEHDFHIGLSLDGPREVHNANRIYGDGYGRNGTFDDVFGAVKRIQQKEGENGKRGIGGGVIAIVTKVSLPRIVEAYQFFRDNGIDVKFNPLFNAGRATKFFSEIGVTPKEYAQAMIRVFDEWFHEPEYRIAVDPFEYIMGNLITNVPTSCNWTGSCQKNFISIGPTGAVYPCGRFDGITDYYLGNINKDGMESLVHHPVRQAFLERSPEGCEPCEYNPICNSGCLHNAYLGHGDPLMKDPFCPAYKAMFSHIKDQMIQELKKAQVEGGS